MSQVGQTSPSGGREWTIYPGQAALRPVTVPANCTLNHIGVWCREQTAANANSLKAAIYTSAGALVYQTSVLSTPITSTVTQALYQIPFSGQALTAGNYVLAVIAGPGTNGVVVVQGQNGPGGVPVSMQSGTDMYPDFPSDASAIFDSTPTRQWDIYLDYTEGGGSSFAITSIADATLTHGQTGVVINVSGYAASGKTVKICPSDDVNDASGVLQTVTAQDASSVTFTAVLNSFSFGTTLYVFVLDGGSAASANADGEPVSRIIASATLNFTGTNNFKNKDGTAAASKSGMTFYIWRAPRPPSSGGTPDQIITGVSTDGSGQRSQSINLGSLNSTDTVYGMLFGADGNDIYWAGEVLPDYA